MNRLLGEEQSVRHKTSHIIELTDAYREDPRRPTRTEMEWSSQSYGRNYATKRDAAWRCVGRAI